MKRRKEKHDIHLVPKECEENGSVCSDSKDGDAAVENHQDILMDKWKPASHHRGAFLTLLYFRMETKIHFSIETCYLRKGIFCPRIVISYPKKRDAGMCVS